MAKNTIAFYTKSGRFKTTLLAYNDPITTLFTAGTNGSKILKIDCITTDFSDTGGYLEFIFNDGTNNNIIVKMNVSELSTNSDIMSYIGLPVNSNGDKYMNIEAGCTIKIDWSNSTIYDPLTFCVYGEDY